MGAIPINYGTSTCGVECVSGRYSQVSRLFFILGLLDESPHGLTVSEIYQKTKGRYPVDKRSVYRDLEALDAAGFPVFEESDPENTRANRWKTNRTLRVSKSLVLSPRELVALYLAKGALTPLKDTPFYQDIESAFQRIETVLGEKCLEYLRDISSGIHFEPGPRWGLGIDSDVIDTVRACCDEGQMMSVVYRSQNSGDNRRRTLGPQFLYFAKGSIYLVAEDIEAKTVKVFAVPRMSDPTMLDEKYSGKAVDPNQFFESALSIFQGPPPEEVKLVFSTTIAQYVRERQWHSSQRLVPLSDGSIQITLHVGVSGELKHWILGFGAEVKVLEPASLQTEVVNSAQAILSLYEKRKGAA